MTQFISLIFNGLALGMAIFLTASGLTLIFGILHVLNFAHGGFLMIAAYIAYSIYNQWQNSSMMAFVAVVIMCTAVLAVLGLVVDRIVLYRLRSAPDDYTLIATYALLLFCDGIVKKIWGTNVMSVAAPSYLAGATNIAEVIIPTYILFLIMIGAVIFFLLDYVICYTNLGKKVQSVALDPWMSGVLGINIRRVRTGTVMTGFALAGIAGAVLSLNQSLTPSMGDSLIIQAFGAIIIGGMGSIRGAFFAAILLGLLTSFGDHFFPSIPSLFFYITMIIILVVRPHGIFQGLR